MIVDIGTGVVVRDADDLHRLKVVTDRSGPALVSALRGEGLGRGGEGEDEVLLDLSELRRRGSAVATDPAWDTGWESMVAYARRSG